MNENPTYLSCVIELELGINESLPIQALLQRATTDTIECLLTASPHENDNQHFLSIPWIKTAIRWTHNNGHPLEGNSDVEDDDSKNEILYAR